MGRLAILNGGSNEITESRERRVADAPLDYSLKRECAEESLAVLVLDPVDPHCDTHHGWQHCPPGVRWLFAPWTTIRLNIFRLANATCIDAHRLILKVFVHEFFNDWS